MASITERTDSDLIEEADEKYLGLRTDGYIPTFTGLP